MEMIFWIGITLIAIFCIIFFGAVIEKELNERKHIELAKELIDRLNEDNTTETTITYATNDVIITFTKKSAQ